MRPDGSTVATDSRWAMAVSPAMESDDDFPRVNGGGVNPPADGALVPVALVTDVLKAIPKRTPKPILKHAQLLRADGDDFSPPADRMVEFGTTDLDRVKREGCRVDDLGKFPDINVVVPGENRTFRVSFGVEALQSVLKAMHEFFRESDSDNQVVELTFRDDESAVLVRGRADNGRQAIAVVMPATDGDDRERERIKHLAGPVNVSPWEKTFGIQDPIASD